MITSAALLFAVAMGALVTGKLIGVKETGFGVAAAVLIDATLVRALLVPSLMALLGERNWWCPRFLRGKGQTRPGRRGQAQEFPALEQLDAIARRVNGDRSASSAKLRR